MFEYPQCSQRFYRIGLAVDFKMKELVDELAANEIEIQVIPDYKNANQCMFSAPAEILWRDFNSVLKKIPQVVFFLEVTMDDKDIERCNDSEYNDVNDWQVFLYPHLSNGDLLAVQGALQKMKIEFHWTQQDNSILISKLSHACEHILNEILGFTAVRYIVRCIGFDKLFDR